MYESLVAEYLEYPVPDYVHRQGGIEALPAPQRNSVVNAVVGVRRCGKTYRLYQLMDGLVKAGVPRERIFYFPFDDDRLDASGALCASQVLEAYYKLVPATREGCYRFFDEIQDASNWAAFIRRVAEQHETTCVVTGSSPRRGCKKALQCDWNCVSVHPKAPSGASAGPRRGARPECSCRNAGDRPSHRRVGGP